MNKEQILEAFNEYEKARVNLWERTNDYFWACDCKEGYIHTKHEFKCEFCGLVHDECDDADNMVLVQMALDPKPVPAHIKKRQDDF